MSSLVTLTVQRLRQLDRLRIEKVPQLREVEKLLTTERQVLDLAQTRYQEFSQFIEARSEIEQEYTNLMELKRDLARVQDQRQATQVRYEELQVVSLREEKALAFYSSVLDDVTQEYVSKLQEALNNVYSYVFQNPNKSVQLDLDDRYNKKVLVLKVVNLFEGEVKLEELKASGFSLRVVMGTVLLVYFILYNGLERFVMFDESFGGLADDTLARFFSLLRVFVDELGFRFLLISHEPRHKDFMDRVYTVRGGRFTEEHGDVEDPEEST